MLTAGLNQSLYIFRKTTSACVNDGFSKIAERAFERERQISHTPFSINRKELLSKSKNQAGPKKSAKEDLVVEKTEPVLKEKSNSVLEKVEEFSAKKDVQITLKRALTDREQSSLHQVMNTLLQICSLFQTDF